MFHGVTEAIYPKFLPYIGFFINFDAGSGRRGSKRGVATAGNKVTVINVQKTTF